MKTQGLTGASWDRTALGTSLAIVFMALLVLIGWHAHIRAAIQIFSALVPMQYNTALCFLALGAAGVGLSIGRRRLLLVGGSFAALMGGLVVVEYAAGVSFGIDTLIFYPWETSLSVTPGRMAVTTAISFFLTGGALVVLAVRRGNYAIFGMVNAFTLGLALTSLIGYAFRIPFILPFSLGSQMALHSAAAFLAYGIAMLGYAWKHAERGPDGLPKWGAGLGVAFLPVLLVGATALVPRQSWRIVCIEALLSIVMVGLIAVAIRRLITARVAYKGLLMITVPLILLFTFVGFALHLKRQSESAQRWALHSTEVLRVSQSLLTHIAETESAVRGFVITGDRMFVDSYEESVGLVAMTTAQLRNLVSDNPQLDVHARKIEQVAAQRTRRFAEIFRLIERGNKTPAQEDIQGETGPELMKQVRAELETFAQHEERLGAERRQAVDTLWQQLSWLLVAGTTGAILLASILTLSFSGGISQRLLQLRDNAISLAAGKELAAPLTGRDEIAELDRVFHEMAEALDEVTRREKAVIEGTTDAIFVKGLDHRFLMMNQGGADLLGKTVEEVLAASDEDLFTPETAQLILERDNEVLAEGKTITYELRATTRNGVERTYLATKGPYRDRHGSIVGVIGINRDITELKQIAAELEHARDAALESVRLKSQFLANMSHEIRTPMNGVIGMTGLLLDTNLSSTQREYTSTIQFSAEALLTIINDILDFSKIEAGLLRFEKIDFDLRGAVEAPVELLAERAQAKGLELASVVYHDVPTALRGDPGRLRQVMTNLIGNAVKFTEQGEVVVSVTRLKETQSHALLRFEILDTGIGISDEAQKGLFRAFIQADGSTTRKYGGTGLGLAISKQLVELMGGEIGIESLPDLGSTFWFTARFEKQLMPANPAGEAVGSLSGVRVLIVDDNATNRNILKHQTGSWGMIAGEAESGARALEMLRAAATQRAPYTIAVLDLTMPHMDGFQLADAIKADPAIASVVLVLLPSFGERGHGERAIRAGIAAYLQKPVRQSQLYECLKKVIAGSMTGLTAGIPALPARLVTTHSMREAEVQNKVLSSLRILLAEDNPVNQQVALGQLYSLGYRAEAVPNGVELLKAMEAAQFDIILMDCHMPEMDGFEATAEIRRREGGRRHTTIIAMTANALEGDEEKCLAAGMDDYLSKPVNPALLRVKLEQWGVSGGSESWAEEPGEVYVSVEEAAGAVIDLVQIARLREIQQPGEPDFVTQLIDLFLEETACHFKILREACLRNDAKEICQLACLLQSSSANIGASQMTALYQQLERQDHGNGDAAVLFARLEQEFEHVRSALDAERQGV